MLFIVTKADKIFNIFEAKLPAYYKTNDIRLSQVQMAFDIAEFLENEKQKIMFVEAPVGTGKSLGSLVPGLIDIKYSNTPKRSVLYATATISLQGQLAEEELPALNKLKLLNRYIVAKGKSHYLCYKNVLNIKEQFSPEKIDILKRFFHESETGHRSELETKYEFDMQDSTWKKIEFTGTPFECRQCDFAHTCPTKLHRSKFNGDHQVTVTNHDQLIVSYLSQLEDSGREPILPVAPGIIVIDEAHHFLENFIGRLELNFSLNELNKLKRILKLKKKDIPKWNKDFSVIAQWVNNKCENAEGSGRFNIPDHVKEHFIKIFRIINGYSLHAKGAKAEQLQEWEIHLSRFFKNSGYISWFSNEDKKFVSIPDDFKKQFRELLQFITRRNKIIFMSGTLTVAGDFSSLFKQWGISSGDVLTRKYDNQFDYENQALIYVPDQLVQPNDSKYKEQALYFIHRLLKLTEGRTLLLNTSKDHMKYFSEGIRPFLVDMNIPLYLQGETGVENLTRMFKENENSVLVGSGSFFSGFSVSGSALTSVILNRLPFPVPEDPVFELLGKGLTKIQFFNQITYPTMVNRLNQASGRLIRKISDYGIFTILDSRVFTNPDFSEDIKYLFNIQGYKMTRSWEEVVSFYSRKLDCGDEAQYKVYKHEDVEVHPSLTKELTNRKKVIRKGSGKTKSGPLKGVILLDEQNSVTEPKKKRLKKVQKDFLTHYCQQSGLDTSKIVSSIKGDPEHAYREVYKWAKENWMDVSILREEFPFRDDDERKGLETFDGGERRYMMPLCTNFNCSGKCNVENRQRVQEHFAKTYGIDIQFVDRKDMCCLINADKSVMLRDEFHPGLERLKGAKV